LIRAGSSPWVGIASTPTEVSDRLYRSKPFNGPPRTTKLNEMLVASSWEMPPPVEGAGGRASSGRRRQPMRKSASLIWSRLDTFFSNSHLVANWQRETLPFETDKESVESYPIAPITEISCHIRSIVSGHYASKPWRPCTSCHRRHNVDGVFKRTPSI